jgi:3-deoxy-D-manno-octulosonic acid kinase
MVNNPSRESLPGVSSSVSAGPETLAPIARGAMLYDASRCGQPDERLFAPDYWRARGALEETAGGRGTVAFVHDGERRWVLRHYRRGGLVAKLLGDRYLWTGADRTRAFREWRLLRELRAAGLPVPVPVAARYARNGLFYRADLITAELPTRRTLTHALAAAPLDAATWRAVGTCIGRLHAHGVHHADLNAHNLLLGGDGQVYVLDFDRGRIRPRGAWERAVLERLQRSLRKVTADLPPDRFDAAAWAALLGGHEGT